MPRGNCKVRRNDSADGRTKHVRIGGVEQKEAGVQRSQVVERGTGSSDSKRGNGHIVHVEANVAYPGGHAIEGVGQGAAQEVGTHRQLQREERVVAGRDGADGGQLGGKRGVKMAEEEEEGDEVRPDVDGFVVEPESANNAVCHGGARLSVSRSDVLLLVELRNLPHTNIPPGERLKDGGFPTPSITSGIPPGVPTTSTACRGAVHHHT